MPQKPAARASAKQVSSGVSPPNFGHVVVAPTDRSDSKPDSWLLSWLDCHADLNPDPLIDAGFFVRGAGFADRFAGAHFRRSDIPPSVGPASIFWDGRARR